MNDNNMQLTTNIMKQRWHARVSRCYQRADLKVHAFMRSFLYTRNAPCVVLCMAFKLYPKAYLVRHTVILFCGKEPNIMPVYTLTAQMSSRRFPGNLKRDPMAQPKMIPLAPYMSIEFGLLLWILFHHRMNGTQASCYCQ